MQYILVYRCKATHNLAYVVEKKRVSDLVCMKYGYWKGLYFGGL